MKKILFTLLFGLIGLVSCNTFSSKEEEMLNINYWENVDETPYPYSGMCFQVLNNNDETNACLASVGLQRNQIENFGNTVCVITKDILYDRKFFDGEYIKIGTLNYFGIDSLYHTVLIIVDKNEYKKNFK